MADRKDSDYILKDILRQKEAIDPATDELREKFTEIIAKYHLNGQGVMAVLAQLSAEYVHRLQLKVATPNDKDLIEDMYQHIFEVFLATFDFQDLQEEVRKEMKLKIN